MIQRNITALDRLELNATRYSALIITCKITENNFATSNSISGKSQIEIQGLGEGLSRPLRASGNIASKGESPRGAISWDDRRERHNSA